MVMMNMMKCSMVIIMKKNSMVMMITMKRSQKTLKTLRIRITLISLNTLPARPIIWVSFNSSTLRDYQ